MAKVDEQKRFCKETRDIQEAGHRMAMKVIENTCKEKETELRAALAASQEQTRKAAQETSNEQVMHGVWFAGGAVAGILVGAVAAGGLMLYFNATSP